MKFNFRYTAKELAKATAVLLHAMQYHPLMVMALMFKSADGTHHKLCVNGSVFLKQYAVKHHHCYVAYASETYVEICLLDDSDTFTVLGLGPYALNESAGQISIPLLSEEEEFQQSLVLSDLEMYTLEYMRECRKLNVPSTFIVLGEFYAFLNEYEQLYQVLEKRYDEFYSSEHI